MASSARDAALDVVPTEKSVLIAAVDVAAEYENSRTRLALDKDTPIPRPVMPPSDGEIMAIREVGGLHHRYERRAA
jgi:hypothetical protein